MSLFDRLQQLWLSAGNQSVPDLVQWLDRPFTGDTKELLDALRWDQQQRWKTSQPLRAEEYLAQLPGLPASIDWMFELAVGEFEARRDTDRPLSEAEISSRFPQLSGTLRDRLIPQKYAAPKPAAEALPDTDIRKPSDLSATYITGQGIGVDEKGRYRLDRVLGEGGFGRVYLGYDDQLHRQVAIKVPTAARFQKPEDAEAYLEEARTVASLDHPNIVPVYDVGRTQDGSIYVVSRFIDGSTLEGRIKAGRPPERESAQMVVSIAKALQYAHERRLIHRDVKPANILLEEKTGLPYVADFGLAIREDDYLKQNAVAGTPAYMSPEQIRGEGHRLDGRSDIFSLGVILYELLSGKRPFLGSSGQETLHLVLTLAPRPPRELVDAVPAELERICLKALSKRASERYATAAEFAEDLEEWLKPKAAPVVTTKASVQVVPKGLRSFDAQDADFFLELLPGQRNRDGLPESIAFWKQRIEETDFEQTFSVGLIYGPSGCGKSSLVKAGLLPNLSKDVIAVYVEATPEETELRILRGLSKRLPSTFREGEAPAEPPYSAQISSAGASPSQISTAWSLTETLLLLRRNSHQKIVIIIDQFEQWLHAHRSEADAELIQALRQCDGRHVQAIVMIRDDFAMAAARFMQALDVAILQGNNFATVDLFEVDHARNVLIKFGQSFGKLPDKLDNLSADEQRFVSDVANGLAQDGKVVSVRLSLFAEMIKSKPWTPETLLAVGGTEGIGVNFLEETFSSSQTNPRHRLHAAAARAVLKSLLPELGTDIKGHMRSQQELLEASGYTNRPSDFTDLLRILDGELRLITPTDPEGDSLSDDTSRNSSLATRYYQLTHDYLVPSLREWLTRKQKETCKGRAELKLEERAAIWNSKRENKQLPTLGEWLSIRTLTAANRWTEPQRSMMRKAAIVHTLSWGGLFLALLIVGTGIQQWTSAERWKNLQKQTETATEAMQNNLGPSVPFNLEKLRTLPEQLVVPELQTRFSSTTNPLHKLSLAFALAAYGKLDAAYLVSRIDDVAEGDTENFVTAMQGNPTSALAAIKTEAQKCSDKPDWRRKAKLAIAALGLGDTELALDVCTFENRPDPEQRTLFIDEFPRWAVDLNDVLSAVKNTDRPALRSGICLAVGQRPVDSLNDADKSSWQTLASQWFAEKSDSSTHSAAGWLLRQWKLPMPEIQNPHEIQPERDWYVVKTSGATMLRIKPPFVSSELTERLPDPLEKYRQQLVELGGADEAEQQTSENILKHAVASYHTGQLEETLQDLDLLQVAQTVPNDPAPGSFPWTVSFFSWPDAGPEQPPADWEAVVKSKSLLEQTLPVLDFHWRTGSLAPEVPKDHFAVIATAEPELAAGVYVLRTTYDDGIRVYLDDQLIFDRWTFNHESTVATEFVVGEGRHTIRVEYFQITGGFALSVDLAAEKSPRLTPGYAQLHAEMLQYRTLALARLGRADEAKQSLAEFLQLDIGQSQKVYAEVQVAAWLGDASAASRVLEYAAQQPSDESYSFYNLACAAAQCAQAFVGTDRSKSEEFTEKSVALLKQSIELGYGSVDEICGDPDFITLHGHRGFGAILAGIQSKSAPVVPAEFWVCDREVSRGQFEQFMNDTNYAAAEKPAAWSGGDTSASPSADHPAQQVSWYDAVMYCNWLSRREGRTAAYRLAGKEKVQNYNNNEEVEVDKWEEVDGSTGYRLPGELEWEYACRAGTTTEFSSGDDEGLLVTYSQMYPSKLTAPCGEKLPNARGLHDVHGNVWEWCWDLLGSDRVRRGGSWSYGAAICRTASRNTIGPTSRNTYLGFRLALSLPSGQSPEADTSERSQ